MPIISLSTVPFNSLSFLSCFSAVFSRRCRPSIKPWSSQSCWFSASNPRDSSLYFQPPSWLPDCHPGNPTMAESCTRCPTGRFNLRLEEFRKVDSLPLPLQLSNSQVLPLMLLNLVFSFILLHIQQHNYDETRIKKHLVLEVAGKPQKGKPLQSGRDGKPNPHARLWSDFIWDSNWGLRWDSKRGVHRGEWQGKKPLSQPDPLLTQNRKQTRLFVSNWWILFQYRHFALQNAIYRFPRRDHILHCRLKQKARLLSRPGEPWFNTGNMHCRAPFTDFFY